MPIVISFPLPAWAQGAEVTCLESLQYCYPLPPGLHTQVILGLHGGNRDRQGGRVLRTGGALLAGHKALADPANHLLLMVDPGSDP